MSLSEAKVVGFIACASAETSRHFYCELLGLELLEETPYALVVEAKNAVVRIQKVETVCPVPYTALGWEVDNLSKQVRQLIDVGIQFERFDGLQQDELGIWTVPGGARIAWFKDPDANLLSLTEFPDRHDVAAK